MKISDRTAEDKLIHVLKVITGFKLCQHDITMSVNLVTAIAIVLLKLGLSSNKSEKQSLQEHLYNFSNVDSLTRQVTTLVIEYIQEIGTETKDAKLLSISRYLTKSEKFLLLTYAHSVFYTGNYTAIENLTKLLRIDNTYLHKIQNIYRVNYTNNHDNYNLEIIEEVKNILSPANFKHLDTAVSNVARDMLVLLDRSFRKQQKIITTETSYEYLQQYKQSCQELNKYCDELHQIMDECQEKNLIPDTFITEISNISSQLQSQRFRVAVVGEFSRGKSTLLNALLKEEIQSLKAVSCSGTVTILKHGKQKRVICRYKDSREEEIPLEQYHEKAAISAALDRISDELATSQIKEIVFEHPDLELCCYGVEILDSPGLNERLKKSAIAEQLVKNTDAVIFLANASRLLTQAERELIDDIKTQLNGEDNNKAANNLFIVVDIMDLLRQKTDRASVKERIERFAYNNSPIAESNNRIHFVSAQTVLDAIQKSNEDEHLNSFHSLTKSIKIFLTNEIGLIKLKQNVEKVEKLIQSFKEQKIENKQDILEKIGVISSWDVELYQLAAVLEKEAINEAVDSWNKWANKLAARIYKDSEQWICNQDDEYQILKTFLRKFCHALTFRLNYWLEFEVKNSILESKFKVIDCETKLVIEKLQNLFAEFNCQVEAVIKAQIELSISKQQINLNIEDIGNIDEQEGDGVGFGLGLGGASFIGGLLAFTGIGLIPLALTAIGSGFGLGALFGESKQDKIKRIVLDKGVEQFYKSQQEIFDKISQQLSLAFKTKLKYSSQVIKEAIVISESLLETQNELEQKNKQLNEINYKIDVLMALIK